VGASGEASHPFTRLQKRVCKYGSSTEKGERDAGAQYILARVGNAELGAGSWEVRMCGGGTQGRVIRLSLRERKGRERESHGPIRRGTIAQRLYAYGAFVPPERRATVSGLQRVSKKEVVPKNNSKWQRQQHYCGTLRTGKKTAEVVSSNKKSEKRAWGKSTVILPHFWLLVKGVTLHRKGKVLGF